MVMLLSAQDHRLILFEANIFVCSSQNKDCGVVVHFAILGCPISFNDLSQFNSPSKPKLILTVSTRQMAHKGEPHLKPLALREGTYRRRLVLPNVSFHVSTRFDVVCCIGTDIVPDQMRSLQYIRERHVLVPPCNPANNKIIYLVHLFQDFPASFRGVKGIELTKVAQIK